MSRRLCLLITASLTLAGCDMASKQDAQYDDARNPNIKQAQQDLDNNNPVAAISDYEQALAANPKMATAHYELGLIYGDKMGDPIGSIFHFKRFLELAPTSDKSDQVKALIDKQSTAFAASLPNSPAQSADDYSKMQNDNAMLKKQVDDLTKSIAQLQTQVGKHHGNAAATAAALPPPAPPATPVASTKPPVHLMNDGNAPTLAASPIGAADPTSTNSAPVPPPRAIAVDTNSPTMTEPTTPSGTGAATASGEPARSYKVVSGDSYWKIAKKMYPGDTKNGVQKIQDANKETVGKPLKIGQVLVIP